MALSLGPLARPYGFDSHAHVSEALSGPAIR